MSKSNDDSFISPLISIRGIMSAAAAAVCTASALSFLGHFHWIPDLFSHFRPQYLLLLCIASAAAVFCKRRKSALFLLLIAVINFISIAPLYFAAQESVPADGQPLRAMLINVNSRTGSPEMMTQAVLDADPDIIVLEEISARWIPALKTLSAAYPEIIFESREDNFGIALLSRLPVSDSRIVSIGLADVPSIIAMIDTDGGEFQIIATHPLPPAGREYSRLRNDQLTKIHTFISDTDPAILMGDLNLTPWNYHFRELLSSSGLIDSTRGRGYQPTWPAHIPLMLIPLDHFLHTSSITVINRETGPNVKSDHYPLIVDFMINP